MELKHTPGPWRVGRKGCVVANVPVPEMRGSEDTSYYGGHMVAESIAEKNGPVIAAAPELLDVVLMIRDADDDCASDNLPRIPAAARAAIDAVIAKATGSAA